jgi:hypothetical protein
MPYGDVLPENTQSQSNCRVFDNRVDDGISGSDAQRRVEIAVAKVLGMPRRSFTVRELVHDVFVDAATGHLAPAAIETFPQLRREAVKRAKRLRREWRRERTIALDDAPPSAMVDPASDASDAPQPRDAAQLLAEVRRAAEGDAHVVLLVDLAIREGRLRRNAARRLGLAAKDYKRARRKFVELCRMAVHPDERASTRTVAAIVNDQPFGMDVLALASGFAKGGAGHASLELQEGRGKRAGPSPSRNVADALCLASTTATRAAHC